jgi:2,4-dienoyl-CoA reductase-like NADH-dependent reductase (Old Yellow Enzyme family)
LAKSETERYAEQPPIESGVPEYLKPGKIGTLAVANRLIRSATSETMATECGEVTDELIGFYGTLARGGAGLLITGHTYVEKIGQCSARQIGIYSDMLVPGLARLTAAVHQNGGRIFCELSHAGSQSVMPNIDPIAPSIIENAIFERQPLEMSADDIERIVTAFGQAARRAAAAGFDGIHIHGGNGYLISQFNSPFSNRRSDQWGGDADRRSRFLLAVYDAVRAAVGPDMPITARYGLADSAPGQLQIDEGLTRLRALVARGLNAVEPTYGLMTTYHENIRPYVAVTAARALQDWVFPRLWQPAQPEAYYLPFAKAVKAALDIPVILVGGIRSTGQMTRALRTGDADFLAAARPFIREPDFPQSLKNGRQGCLIVSLATSVSSTTESMRSSAGERTPRISRSMPTNDSAAFTDQLKVAGAAEPSLSNNRATSGQSWIVRVSCRSSPKRNRTRKPAGRAGRRGSAEAVSEAERRQKRLAATICALRSVPESGLRQRLQLCAQRVDRRLSQPGDLRIR